MVKKLNKGNLSMRTKTKKSFTTKIASSKKANRNPKRRDCRAKNEAIPYEKPEIKALDMSCSQRPDWSCGPCSLYA